MNLSLNWLKDYLDIDLSPDKVSELLTEIGLEVEGMEEVESIKGGMKGIVIGHVLESGRHPNADKLSVTKVDVGQDQLLDIVCGAPNVAAGQKVLVAGVGTTLYSREGEEWKIKRSKIRGEVSEGMICAEDEVGLGDQHEGIIVLPEEVAIGTLASDYYNIEKDYVYEIGLTPNRSDATNHIGAAKDVAAALKINFEHSGEVRLPSVEDFKVDNNDMPIEVVVENTAACPRYSGVSIKGVQVKESPDWLKNRLKSIGVRPISNIVDITNFVLHEFGQPLHAFDLDQIPEGKVIVKTLEEGSTFVSLDEVERKLSAEDLMICDGNEKSICIGGVFGGITSGVTDGTKNIFLESAHFNAKSIRRSSMRHNLRTDAAMVFEKGSDPNVTVYALKRAALLMKELAGAEIASEIVDVYPEPIEPKAVELSFAHINRLIGVEMSKEKIKDILGALEMDILEETDSKIKVSVPTNKADVTREADVIEEILRIYGFDNVPTPVALNTAVTVSQQPDPNRIRNVIGDFLAAAGFNEMMAVSLSRSKYYENILPMESKELVFINNTSNVHLDIMRPDMLFSGLEAVVHNQNRQQINLKLYEFGRSYKNTEKRIDEKEHLSLFLCGQFQPESWLNTEKRGVDYFALKTYVENILNRLALKGYQATAINDEVFAFGMKYHRGPQELVSFGKITPGLAKKMDVRGDVFYAVFNWGLIMKALKSYNVTTEEISKYPSMRRDLALIIDNSIKFNDIVAIAKKTEKKLLKEINLFDVYENDRQLGKGKKSCAVSFVFEDSAKTLKDKEVDKIMNRLIQKYETQLNALIRR